MPTPVLLFVANKMLTEGPVAIADRHTDTGVGIKHLLSGNQLDLIGIGIEFEFFSDSGYLSVVFLYQFEGPFGSGRDRLAHWVCFLKKSRNTG